MFVMNCWAAFQSANRFESFMAVKNQVDIDHFLEKAKVHIVV